MSSSIKNSNYRVKSTVRGYHVYRSRWTPDIGTMYPCRRVPNNEYDSNAVAVCKLKYGIIVGYVPREHAAVYSSSLQMQPPVTLHCIIIGKPIDTRKGQELPCEYLFESSSEENIRTIRNKLEALEEGAYLHIILTIVI